MALLFGVAMKMYRAFDAVTAPAVEAGTGKFDLVVADQWQLVPNHMGFSLNLDHVEDDVTVAGSTFELSAAVLNKVGVQFKVPYDTTNTFCAQLLAASIAMASMPLLFLTNTLTGTPLFGMGGYWSIKCNMPADLKTAVKLDVTCTPTYNSTVLPHVFNVAAAG